jgi:hypothetical protein
LALKRAKSDEREAKKAHRQMETDTDEDSVHSTSSFSVESFQPPQTLSAKQGTSDQHIQETVTTIRNTIVEYIRRE